MLRLKRLARVALGRGYQAAQSLGQTVGGSAAGPSSLARRIEEPVGLGIGVSQRSFTASGTSEARWPTLASRALLQHTHKQQAFLFGDSGLQFAHIWRGCPSALIEPGVLDTVYAHLRPPPKTAPGVNDMFNAWDKAFPPVSPEAIEPLLAQTKRTYQPSLLIRKRRHGFLERLRSKDGRLVIARRIAKGRRKIAA